VANVREEQKTRDALEEKKARSTRALNTLRNNDRFLVRASLGRLRKKSSRQAKQEGHEIRRAAKTLKIRCD
jgi:hypothetical protein